MSTRADGRGRFRIISSSRDVRCTEPRLGANSLNHGRGVKHTSSSLRQNLEHLKLPRFRVEEIISPNGKDRNLFATDATDVESPFLSRAGHRAVFTSAEATTVPAQHDTTPYLAHLSHRERSALDFLANAPQSRTQTCP